MSDKREKKNAGLSSEAIDGMKREMIYGVGYRKPPEHSRFQKGQSGNPNGRPRSAPASDISLDDLPTLRALLKGADQTVKMRDGDKVTEVPLREALIRAMQATALKGDPRAQRLLLEELKAAEVIKAIEIRKSKRLAYDYKASAYSAIEAARAAGTEPPCYLPHPDDVIIDNGMGFRVVGPVDEDEQAKLEDTLGFRDALILQDALDQRLAPSAETPIGRPGGALLSAIALNETVPQRFRLSDNEFTSRMLIYEALAKRVLLREVYQAWQALGRNVPRGFRFPSFERAQELMAFGVDTIVAIKDGRLDFGNGLPGSPNRDAEAFFQHWADRINAAPG